MNVLIFTIGFIIFITYMFFLLRMVNRAHKSQERAQGKYNYKRQVHVTKKRGSMGAGDYYIEKKVIRRDKGKSLWRTSEKREIKDRWDS